MEDSAANWHMKSYLATIFHMLTVNDKNQTVWDGQALGVSRLSTLRETLQ